jgi:hypothetical protein
MYTTKNFRTKKELKTALANGELITVFQYGMFNPGGPYETDIDKGTKTVYLEGPHYPAPHMWYATGQLVDGELESIK